MKLHPEIFKKDSKGKTRVWAMQSEGPRYRTVAGIYDGNLVTSEWTTCTGKQGRTDEEQCEFEVAAAYKHKLTREYHENLEDIEQGAHFFKPMLAKEFAGWQPGWHEVVVQPKLDGIRCITTKDGMFSRQGKPITAVPHIHASLAPLFEKFPDVVLDGELYNHELKDDFNAIVSIVRKQDPTAEELELAEARIQYHVYDVPTTPFSCTKMRLDLLHEEIIGLGLRGAIELVPTSKLINSDEVDLLYGQYVEAGYEGQMIRLPGKYEQKRSKLLLKRKDFKDDEFELVAIEEGQGNWSGVAKRAVCRLPDGRTFGAGIKGTRERAAELLGEKHNVVTIKFFDYTPDGVPRFPVATKFHGAERTL